MDRAGEFTSSNELLNKIHRNMFWGIRGNYRSIPTDCPQRDERQGWLGDRGQVSRSESYMFDVAAFYSKWMTDLEDSQRPSGSIPDVSPNYWTLYNDDLTWPGTIIFVHGMLYDQYADKRVLARGYDAMKKWIDYEKTFVKDGLISKDQYADWCVPPEDPKLIHSKDPARVTDKTLIATSYYYELLRQMSRYARILDKPTDAAEFDRRSAAMKDVFQRRFFKLESSMYDNGTQTSSILPLYFGMVPEDFRPAVVQTLVRNIQQKSDNHVGTGLVGAQWLMRTLSDNGQADLAYKIATQKTYPGWGYMVEQGATTMWELWNGNTADPAMNSGNHVMQIGDLAVWMYEYLAGIRTDPEKPGFRHAIIRPYPAGDLTFVKATHKTMYGALNSSWKREKGQFTLDVTVPANTTATVWVPAKDAAAVTESGKKASEVKGVKFVRSEGASAIFEVESGAYSFKSAMIEPRVRSRRSLPCPLDELPRQRIQAVGDAVGLHIDQLVALDIGHCRHAPARDDPRGGRAGRQALPARRANRRPGSTRWNPHCWRTWRIPARAGAGRLRNSPASNAITAWMKRCELARMACSLAIRLALTPGSSRRRATEASSVVRASLPAWRTRSRRAANTGSLSRPGRR